MLQNIVSTLGQHLYDIRPTVNFDHNSDRDIANVDIELTLDQRLANVGIKYRQLRPKFTVGEYHINVGPTLKQCLAQTRSQTLF